MAAVDPEQRKAAIVAASFDLVADGGIEAATMRRVATAADATTGRVTHYFSPRVELLVATIAEVQRRRSIRVSTHDGLDPADRLRSTLRELLPLDADRLDEQRVWISLCTTGIPELRDEIERQTVQRDVLVAALVEKVRASRADATIEFSLNALVDGLAHRLLFDTRPKARRAAQHALDDALHSLEGAA